MGLGVSLQQTGRGQAAIRAGRQQAEPLVLALQAVCSRGHQPTPCGSKRVTQGLEKVKSAKDQKG